MKEFNLEELSGVGPVTVRKLKDAGIYSPLDIVVRGAKEFSRISGLSEEAALKHMKSCLDMVADEGLNVKVDDIDELEKVEESVLQFPVNVDDLDEMTDGGFETQALYEVYGDEGSGKTQLSMSLAMEVMGKGHGVMIIDCEGNIKTKRMKEIAEARGIEYKKEQIGFHKYLDEALLFEGIQNIVPELMEKDVKLLVIDGLVGVMRLAYQGRGELADRQMELKDILKYLRNMAALFNICVIITNQVTANPDPFGAKLKPIGGHVMGHYCKYIISFTKGMKNNRIVKLIKSPSHPQGEYKCYLNEEGVSQHESLTKKIKDKRMSEVAREDTQGLIIKDDLVEPGEKLKVF
jgi:DNA repair protein RadA